MQLVNRSALSVRPTRAFVDWINSLEATEGDDDLTLADVEQESTVYLIPEMDSLEALQAYVRERYLDILENELQAWEEDRRYWPEPLDEAMFERFLSIEYSYMTLDLGDDDALDSVELDDDLLLDNDEA
ncbi:hypothetical protein C7446_1698 [Kushneria sinocarnis]|uniref:Uncharacterized protein n=1 Tax=Kushneria sinocarnis TaxID=595502 RepID=A0A420WXK7_9GAMM|nr:hypothetical protein [Kushneria sinocarnis]RKR04489.1 hypothetical protein C7446_1698 [Kushneria sinocarnis]